MRNDGIFDRHRGYFLVLIWNEAEKQYSLMAESDDKEYADFAKRQLEELR